MNIIHRPETATRTAPAQHFVLYPANWSSYEKMLDIVGNRRIRVTYDRGTLEIMSPLPIHEVYKTLFGRLFDALLYQLDIPIKALGSTTYRREDQGQGLEPDQSYYLASAARVRSWATLDLAVDPPPDLAIEVDITRSSLDRMGVYAGLRVPEVWRFDGETLEAFGLTPGGVYEPIPRSLSLPYVPLAEVPPLLHQSMEAQDDRALLRGLRDWVRNWVAPLKQAATS